MFLVAGIFLFTVNQNIQAGRRRLRWRRWWQRAVAPEPGAERQAATKQSSPRREPLRSCSKADQRLSGLPGCQPGTAKVALLKDSYTQTDITGLCVADTKCIRCQRHSAVATVISKLCLSQARSRKISMHIARKCLEIKLRFFPVRVRKSIELLQRLQQTQGAPDCTLKKKYPLDRDRIRRAARAPGSRPIPTYFHSREALFLSEEEREKLELHIRAKKLECLWFRLPRSRTRHPSESSETESTCTYVTAPSEDWTKEDCTEAGPKRHRWWPWWKTCPRGLKRVWSTHAECSSPPPASLTS
ncbi:uncharacterized protein LOC107306126 isoform X2 [Coturnix japonica]|uniref:uncharacterized protein LOC107306126 isoform X2 n=1 Tax=Coturnix japonica TaxID=93934 RepID=UPI000776C691|nr:uncharacterized protein LOC107306126 isoform X2 [Coturnix japonica]